MADTHRTPESTPSTLTYAERLPDFVKATWGGERLRLLPRPTLPIGHHIGVNTL